MFKTFFAAATLLIAVSSLAQASVPILGETDVANTNSRNLDQGSLLLKSYAENDQDGNDVNESEDDNGGKGDDDDTGCTAAKSHSKYTICHG
jgi:hypothetical protein